jgi:hypothetical protein
VPLADFTFHNVVLAVHIGAVIVGFGVTFAYPILFGVAARSDPRSLPMLHRAVRVLNGRLMSAALVVVVLAGLYLAGDSHAFKYFYVQWGIGAALVIGAVGGAYLAPRDRRLVELSERDVAGAAGAGGAGGEGGGSVVMSTEYQELVRQVSIVGGLLSALVLVTVLFMATHLGGP